MKRFINYTMIMLLGTFIAFNAAVAAQRVKIVELAESGMTIEFPMTAAEIAAEDAERARQTAIRAARAEDSKERLEQIELAESGQTIEFYQVTPRMATELPETEIAKGNPEDSRASVR
jgi:hypothetical protein